MLFPILGPSSLPVVVASLTKDMQTEQLLYWSGMTDTKHATSGLNEEEAISKIIIANQLFFYYHSFSFRNLKQLMLIEKFS